MFLIKEYRCNIDTLYTVVEIRLKSRKSSLNGELFVSVPLNVHYLTLSCKLSHSLKTNHQL